MSSIVQTISVPSGGKVAELLQDMKNQRKNVSQTVCAILERHSTLYDDNIRLQEENRQLLHDYHTIIAAATTALERGGEKWELHFPPSSTIDYVDKHGDGGYGLKARVHFKMVDKDQ